MDRAKLDEAIRVAARDLGEAPPAALTNREFKAIQAAENEGSGPPPERTIAENLIAFLADRRVLYNPSEVEVAQHCIESVFRIRAYLSGVIDQGGIDVQLSDAMRAMRAACRRFLTRIRLDPDRPGCQVVREYGRNGYSMGLNGWTLNQALGELRGAFGIHIAAIAGRFGVPIEPDLSTILPAEPE